MNYGMHPRQNKGGLWLPNQKPLYSSHSYVDDERCVACWLFNEMGGNVAHDISIYGNDGILTSAPLWSGGKFGTSLLFDSSASHVDVVANGMTGFPTGADPRTIVFWFNASSFDTGVGNCIVSYSQEVANGQKMFIIGEDNAISVAWQGHRTITPKATLSTDVWYQGAIVIPDGAANTDDAIFYIDGVAQSVTDEAGSAQTLNSQTLDVGVGGIPVNDSSIFDGFVDHVRIYDAGLSEVEIQELFHNPFHDIKTLQPGAFGVVGGTTYFQAVSATTTPAASLVKQTNKPISAASAPATTLAKQTNKSISAVSAPAITLSKVTQRAISAVGTGAADSPGTQTNKGIDATTTPAVTLQRQANKVIEATGLTFVALQKQVNRVITTTTVPSASIAKRASKTITAAATGVATLVGSIKTAFKSVTATTIPVANIDTLPLKLVVVTTTPIVSVSKETSKSISAVALGVAVTSKVMPVAVNATATGVAATSGVRIASVDVPEPATRLRKGRKSPYVVGLMDFMGLHQSGEDQFGILRSNEKNTTKAWWEDTVTRPGNPLRRPSHKYFFDRTEDVGSDRFAETAYGSGTVLTLQDRRGGWAKFTNGSGDNEYYFYEAVNEVGAMVDGKHIWFDTEIEITDVDEADMFVGLCATLGSGNLFDNRVDCVGFTLADGSAGLNYVATKDGIGSPAMTGETLSNLESVKLSFVVTGLRRVDFHVDDRYVGNAQADLPDDVPLSFVFGLRNGQAAGNAMSLTTSFVLLD